MESYKIKIAILSSSRADYGIYLPLINKLSEDKDICLELIAFGTHFSKLHGYTIQSIDVKKFSLVHELEHILSNDSPNAISTSFGLISLKFADFWKNNFFNVVICLGDRFEMAAAVLSGLPYKVNFAHLHGGETTLGAIDNVYRHTISLASELHFTSTEKNKERLSLILGHDRNIYNVGSLSLDNLNQLELLSHEEFFEKWAIDLNKKYILITIHPETVDFEKNEKYAIEFCNALEQLSNLRQLIITMPNADTSGSVYREKLISLNEKYHNKVVLIENFGTVSYFTCMKYADIILGNSSSGIIEAASFGKYVINVGDRQKGRQCDDNVINVRFDENLIVEKTLLYLEKPYNGKNSYFNGGAVENIIYLIKQNYDKFR